MPDFTIFWKHPRLGEGSYTIAYCDAQSAGDDALDELASDMSDDPEDDLDVSLIRDDLDVVVYAGAHNQRPETPPAYIVR